MGTALLEEAAEEAEEIQSSMSVGLIIAILVAVMLVAGGIAVAIKLPSRNTPVTRIIYSIVSVAVSAGALIMGVFANREHAIGEDIFFVIFLGLYAFALIWLQPKTFIYNLLLDIVLGLVLTILSVFIASYNIGWLPGLAMIIISFICMGYHTRRLIKRNKYIRYQEAKLEEQQAAEPAQAPKSAPHNKRQLKQAIMYSQTGTEAPAGGADGAKAPADEKAFKPSAQQDGPAASLDGAEDRGKNAEKKPAEEEDKGLDLDIDPFDTL
ncbi:MAG: hypothetical protein LUD51_05215 [Clostridia bacterium]|nr:hypothetical protein [Clostridia bacterium]